MGLIEGLSINAAATIVYLLGLPGAILILWYVDNRRYDRLEKKRDAEIDQLVMAIKEQSSYILQKNKDELARVLSENKSNLDRVLEAYRDDVRTVSRFYEDNVLLVKNYEKLANDLASIITLNTQVQTTLVQKIEANMFCPEVRKKGGGV